MKRAKISLLILFFGSLLVNTILQAENALPAPLQAAMPALCDFQYENDMRKTLQQFSGFTDKNTLKQYQDFEIRVKYHTDLGLRLRPFERNLTADILAKWRTPLQHYTTCRTAVTGSYQRNVRVHSLSQDRYEKCDQTYAIESQILLREQKLSPSQRAQFEQYLVELKQRADLYMRMGDFEQLISNEKINKLRDPQKRYNNCVDAVIRNAQPYSTYGTNTLKR